MHKFEKFFASLYSDDHCTIDSTTKQQLINKVDNINSTSKSNLLTEDILNKKFTEAEVQLTIKSLKSGKASSDDMIANDIPKLHDSKNSSLLTYLFKAYFGFKTTMTNAHKRIQAQNSSLKL